MKPEELSIGDWVNVNRAENVAEGRYIEWQEIGMVVAISECFVSVRYGDDEFDWEEVSMDAVEPIPITPEILEKNGFFYNKYCEWILGADDESLGESEIEIYLEESYDNEGFFWKYCGVLIKRIYFVHELQHAFRLCRVNKTIEL